MTRGRGSEDGFTLIEALVAMAVLATGAVGLLTAVERHAGMARGLGDRTVARWAAENRLTEIALGLPAGDATVTLMEIDWQVASALTATADPDLLRIDVTVAPSDGGATREPLVRMTGFVDIAAVSEEARP